jgi:hypothetical protein
MTTKDKQKLDQFNDWRKLAQDSMNYAVERFDLLIIAISTTGIIIALNVLKTSLELELDMPSWIKLVVKISILSFSASVICNFWSQLSSKAAFRYEKFWSELVIREIEGEAINEQ